MNDITALALLVSKAKASVFTMEYISQFEADDIDSDDVDLRFEVDGVETGTNVSIVDECGQAAQMIMALVEALESGDTENKRMARDLISRNGEIEGLRKRVEELEEVATDYGMKFQRAQDDLKKMALIHRDESRTVTVKLPKRSVGEVMHMSGFSRDYAEGWCSGNDNAINEMKLAGIQVIEGEA